MGIYTMKQKEAVLEKHGWVLCQVRRGGRWRNWWTNGEVTLPAPEAYKLVPHPAPKGGKWWKKPKPPKKPKGEHAIRAALLSAFKRISRAKKGMKD